ncbi:hypothetical protein F4780DRAFT_9249 [Xylariomycetidae sp. FL0641]|nr:hypothetical protein F4780DRAFT_9249 [Xylariomycetidae sp. FL0641]
MPHLPEDFTMAEEDIVLVTQLPSDSWFEGFVTRPNGKILATRLDQPELYTFDGEDEETTPKLVTTFDECNSLINISALPGRRDEYVVLTGYLNLEACTCKDCIVWHVKLDENDAKPPTIEKITALPMDKVLFPLGMEAVSEHVCLIPDSASARIWRMDTRKGEVEEFLADEATMKINSAEDFFGLNRLCLKEGFLWFTNTSAGKLCRVPIEMDEDVGIRTTGPIQIVNDTLTHCDGLAISNDQTRAYTASYVEGQLWEVKLDPKTGTSTVETIVTSLDSPTSVQLVHKDGKPKLYIVCCGEIEMGWIPQDGQNPWKEMGDLNAAITSVTVTESVGLLQ